jgi:hypothetical protein
MQIGAGTVGGVPTRHKTSLLDGAVSPIFVNGAITCSPGTGPAGEAQIIAAANTLY